MSQSSVRNVSKNIWIRAAIAMATFGCTPSTMEMPEVRIADVCSLHAMPGVEVRIVGHPSDAHVIAYRGEVDPGATCDGHACCGTAQYVYAVECDFGTIVFVPADETGIGGQTSFVCPGRWDGTLESPSCPPGCPGDRCNALWNVATFDGRLDATPRELPTPESSRPIYGFLVHGATSHLVLFDCGAQPDASH
jgi:hypothetical protein